MKLYIKKSVLEVYIEIVKVMYRNSASVVRTAVGESCFFSITIGVHRPKLGS